ncbi:hypothetical protein HDU76_004660, partial [Blyttiomyces sp. JEL0837]
MANDRTSRGRTGGPAPTASSNPKQYTVLVTVREGRFFSYDPHSKIYVQCRFNNEILTTDPTPHIQEPIWDTELAWKIHAKPLGFLRSQRAKLKLICYEIDSHNRRTQLGYIMLDLRSASNDPPRWTVDPETSSGGAWAWYPLVNVASHAASSVFRPEVKVGFSVLPEESLNRVSSPSSRRRKNPSNVRGRGGGRLGGSGGAGAGGSFGDSGDGGHGFHGVGGMVMHDHPTVLSSRGSPIMMGGPGVAFAENLQLLVDPDAEKDAVAAGSTGYYFYYAFLGNHIITERFFNLQAPNFPSERVSFRIRSSDEDLTSFVKDADQMLIHLCRDGVVLGFAEIHLSEVMGASALSGSSSEGQAVDGAAAAGSTTPSRTPGSPRLSGARTKSQGRDQTPRVVEQVYTLFGAKQELPISVDSKLPSIGISLVLTPDLEADVDEVQRMGAVGMDDGTVPEMRRSTASEQKVLDPPSGNATEETKRKSVSQDVKVTEGPSVKTDAAEPPRVSQVKAKEESNYENRQSTSGTGAPRPSMSTANQNAVPPKPLTTPKNANVLSWHQYRFSIDLRSIRGLSTQVGSVYLKYSYAPFGTTSPIMTHPPVAPVTPPAATSTSTADLLLPHSFCAFEFVMGRERLETYLEAVPLVVEVWGRRDRYDRDASVGVAT